MLPMPAPALICDSVSTLPSTGFVFALNDPEEIGDEVEPHQVIYVKEENSEMAPDDDCVMPILCDADDEGARPFGVVSDAALVGAVKSTSYISVVCAGWCQVDTGSLYAENEIPVAGEKVWIGAHDGIPATLLVYDAPTCQVLVGPSLGCGQ